MMWDQGFELAPEASGRFARALWDHQVADHRTGAFDRHAGYWRHATWESHDDPRHAGFLIRTWGSAYGWTKDGVALEALGTVLRRFEGKRRAAGRGLIESHVGSGVAWPASTLSMAIDCDGAAHGVPEGMASRLRAFAEETDAVFCGLPHALDTGGGFAAVVALDTGKRAGDGTSMWRARYGGYTTAQGGMMCVSRLDNTGTPAYRALVLAAADAYLDAAPPEDVEVWPGTVGQAISLQVAAWRHTARAAYLDRARWFADWGVKQFWGEKLLPRAGTRSDHYEAITGADTLALAMVELHLQILGMTAVRCPSNTIDR
jgi:hypothetical protein